MLKEILKNIAGRGNTLRFPDEFQVSPEGAARFPESAELKEKLDAVFGRSLRIRQVDAGSCNACEWECTALTNPVYDIQRFGVDFVASPRHADLLLVTGPVSRQMELALKKTWLATPEPRLVLACGDCAADGGVYRGSYAVVPGGVATVVPVDCYIPGCPPTPSALLSGLLALMDSLAGGGAPATALSPWRRGLRAVQGQSPALAPVEKNKLNQQVSRLGADRVLVSLLDFKTENR